MMASSSGQFIPGNLSAPLGDLKQSHTTRMLQQSSKFSLDQAECTEPTEIASTPRKTPDPKEVLSIEIGDSPAIAATSGSKKRPPQSQNKSGRPDVRRQLFPSLRRASPKKKAAATPKPQGYWKLLVQFLYSCMLQFVQTIYRPIRELRVRRHFQPNSKGELKCSPHILEMGKTIDGRFFE